ncbi:unnamed protein product [Lactuca virosa]|uniref:TIR domain-containing protein n=1 Tax=Lactuca virosa TaxID=75947 RepID=A0AAU9NAP1_9ASTR|nr:unnamed protein product [Lactuca virosa]
MECQKETEQIAYPVFYDVDPSEVRQQLDPVGEAFSRNNKGEVGKWREALKEAANLAGWDLRKTSDGHEAKVINKIVEKISLELRFLNLKVDEKLVGMESRIKDIVSSLEIGVEDVRMIALESCGFHARNGLRVLQQKSLITISPDQRLGMHDHIEEMGRNIVRRSHPDEPIRHSRLWIGEEIKDVLVDDLVTGAIRAIATNTSTWFDEEKLCSTILTNGFGNLKKLRFLHVVSGSSCSFEVGQNFPNALRFLSWHCYPHYCLPKTFQPNNLVALEMPNSRIKQLWHEGEGKVLKNLRFLDLSYSKLTTIDCGLLPNLETLKLEKCRHLVEPHTPIGCLRKLVLLNLNGCVGFKSLSFIKPLESLRVLDLSNLYLTKFPDILPEHSNYSLLAIYFSKNNIQELPSSIGSLQKLVYLDLKELPEDLGHLESLEWLNLGGTRVEHLPNSICMLKNLKTLLLTSCKVVMNLPEDIGLLESLEELSLAFCKIRDVPSSICKLTHLREFDLGFCDQLERLPEKLGDLKSLEELNVQACPFTKNHHRNCIPGLSVTRRPITFIHGLPTWMLCVYKGQHKVCLKL